MDQVTSDDWTATVLVNCATECIVMHLRPREVMPEACFPERCRRRAQLGRPSLKRASRLHLVHQIERTLKPDRAKLSGRVSLRLFNLQCFGSIKTGGLRISQIKPVLEAEGSGRSPRPFSPDFPVRRAAGRSLSRPERGFGFSRKQACWPGSFQA